MIDEFLEERVVYSRCQVKPQCIRQKMSGFPLCQRGPVSRREHRWTPEIVSDCIKGNSIAPKVKPTRAWQTAGPSGTCRKYSGKALCDAWIVPH